MKLNKLILLLALFSVTISCSPNKDEDTVKLGYLRIGSDLPLFVADSMNLFEKHGLEVELVRFGNSNQVIEAFGNGDISVTDIIGSSVVMKYAETKKDFKIFMISEANSKTNIHQLVVSSGSKVGSVNELVGKKLAIFPGSQMRVYVKLFLKKYLDEEEINQIELVPLSPPQQLEAMRLGQIDAALTLEPTGTSMNQEEIGTTILNNVLYESITKPRPFVTALAIMNNNLDERKKQALISAYSEASYLIDNNPNLARKIMANWLNLDSSIVQKISLYKYPVGREIDLGNIELTEQIMYQNGLLNLDIPFDELIIGEK